MRHRAPRPRLETGMAGDGPAATATVVVGIDGSSASWAAFCWACGEVHADLIVVGRSASTPRRLAGSVGQRLAARRRESAIVVVPPHCEAFNLPGGVSDETSPGRSPRSHRS
jgi:hypothetical protein